MIKIVNIENTNYRYIDGRLFLGEDNEKELKQVNHKILPYTPLVCGDKVLEVSDYRYSIHDLSEYFKDKGVEDEKHKVGYGNSQHLKALKVLREAQDERS